MKEIFIPDFHLFDGEGGGGEGATASQSDSQQDIQSIQYGKSKGEERTSSQVGSDKKASEADALDAEWKALTGKGGKFHDLYGQGVSNAIQDRFRNQADLQAQVNQIGEDLTPLFMNYGLKVGDYEGLSKAIAGDDALFQAGAERAGLDINQYRQNLKLQAEAERGRAITEAYEAQMRQNEMFARWESDAVELQQAFPAFDLGMEIESNPAFAELLNNGVDVRTAFISTHLDDVLNGASQYAQRTATKNVVNTIQQRAARPMEGAVNSTPALHRKSDPSKLTDKDLDEINRRVANGEVISF